VHGPNWGLRKRQAAALLKQAASADISRRQQLEKRAADLLAPTRFADRSNLYVFSDIQEENN
jgi:hypothetical protein